LRVTRSLRFSAMTEVIFFRFSPSGNKKPAPPCAKERSMRLPRPSAPRPVPERSDRTKSRPRPRPQPLP